MSNQVRPANSEFYKYERYGYIGDERYEFFKDLDVTRCPRCDDVDMFPGDRVCSMCMQEINNDDFS